MNKDLGKGTYHIPSSCVNALDACFLQSGFELVCVEFPDVAEDQLGRHFDSIDLLTG